MNRLKMICRALERFTGLGAGGRNRGGIKTSGRGIAPTELHGAIERFAVTGGLIANGGGFDHI
jgi:hypothetical protein